MVCEKCFTKAESGEKFCSKCGSAIIIISTSKELLFTFLSAITFVVLLSLSASLIMSASLIIGIGLSSNITIIIFSIIASVFTFMPINKLLKKIIFKKKESV